MAVAILGGAVTWAYRWLDDRRDERRRLDDYRVSVIGELQDAYYEAKTVRRALRAAGFKSLVPPVTLNPGQHDIFETRMEQLDDARTALEKLVDVAQGRERIYGRDHEKITRLIHEGEAYLGRITEIWEQGLLEAAGGGKVVDISALTDFLGAAKGDAGIKCRLSKPIREAVTRIHSLRFSRLDEPPQPS
jgi:hypothetical protein